MTKKRHRIFTVAFCIMRAVWDFVDSSIEEFAGQKGKPSQNSEGLHLLEKYGIIKSGQIAYATRSLPYWQKPYILIETYELYRFRIQLSISL